MNKRGEESSPQEKVVVYVLLALGIILIAYGAYAIFGERINTFFENLPGFGWINAGGTSKDIGLFRYSMANGFDTVDASHDGVVQYYDGLNWKELSGREDTWKIQSVNGNLFSGSLLSDAFGKYFLSLCKGGRTDYEYYIRKKVENVNKDIAFVEDELLKIDSCGIAIFPNPFVIYEKSFGDNLGMYGVYVILNDGKYVVTGNGKVYAKDYRKSSGGDVLLKDDSHASVRFSVDKGEGSPYLTAPLEIKEVLDAIDGRSTGFFDPANRVSFIEELVEDKLTPNDRPPVIPYEERKLLYLQCDRNVDVFKTSSGEIPCEVVFGDKETGIIYRKIPQGKLQIYLSYISDSNSHSYKYNYGGQILVMSSDKGYNLVSGSRSEEIWQSVFDFLDKGLSEPMDISVKKKGESVYSHMNVCVERIRTDYLIDVNEPAENCGGGKRDVL